MNNKITFPRLATLLADRSGRSKRFSEDFLREFFSLISETLEAHETVKIKGLGTFRLTRVEPRRSVDVTTGEPMEISGHTKVVFIPVKELAEAVNSPFEAFSAIEIKDGVDIDQLFSNEEIDIRNDNEESAVGLDYESELTETEESTISKDVDDVADNAVEDINATKLNEEIIYKNPDEELKVEAADDTMPVKDTNAETDTLTNSDSIAEDTIAETDTSTESDTVNESEGEISSDEEISGEAEEFEEENTPRKKWVRGLLITLAAAVTALIATFIIWYYFTDYTYNDIFKKSGKASVAAVGSKPANGDDELKANSVAPGSEITSDSVADTLKDNETEEEVPTAPSDIVVYDTIGTTRYLTTMAKAHYGNYNLWPYIYEENKSFLGHPDRIRPGTPVVIPKLSKYGVDPSKTEDIEKAKKMGIEIYARYGKKI